MRSHLLSFCNSVKVSLAIVKEDQAWHPLYFLAEYDYLPPESSFKTLFHSPQFRIISGTIQMIQWQGFEQQVRNGGKLDVSLNEDETLTVAFVPWEARRALFATGLESRQAWNRNWPHLRTDFFGDPKEIKMSLWEVMQNAVVTYEVPYSTVSEAVSDILNIKEDRLEFKTGHTVHGSVLIPLFAFFESAEYVRENQAIVLTVQADYYSELNSKKLCVSARVGRRDETVERLSKRSLPEAAARGPGETICRSEWQSNVKTPSNSIRHTTLYLVYEALQDSPLLVDEFHLWTVPALTPKSEIERLMTERMDRRRERDYLSEIEKKMFDAKGTEFEEAVFGLLCRMGFDVAWENRNHPFDILAASANGCLVVECTWDTPSVAMARELIGQAQSYRSVKNPLVVPVLATNRTSWSDLDKDLLNMELRGEVYFMTRDRLMQALDKLEVESASRTAAYLGLFKW